MLTDTPSLGQADVISESHNHNVYGDLSN